jgi:hypothetical protein
VAVTVEGAFVLRDRASTTLRKIREEAERTDRAVTKLGHSLDEVGAKKQLAQMSAAEREMGKLSKTTSSATKVLDEQTRSLEKHRRKTNETHTALERFGKKMILVFGGLGKVFGLLKIPALIVGFTSLVPIIAALGAGVTSLVPKLTNLVGVLGALPATFLGLGLAMGTVKLAFADIGKAMGGNAQALKRLTPEARRFTETLKSWKPLVDQFRRSAQRGLFAGLDASLERLRVAAPMVNRLLSMMGSTLGHLADQASRRFTGAGFLSDFESLGRQGGTIVSRMGKGLINLIDALRHVAMAAQPFTNWLTKTIYGWTKWADGAARAGRESGRMARWFSQTRTTLEQFGRIAHNIWDVLVAIGHAARPLGDDLYKSAVKATDGWKTFFQSVGGQVATRRFFASTRDTLRETFGLVKDVSQALARIGGQQTTGAAMVKTLRDIVPPLERMLTAMMKAFGPTAIQLLSTFAQTLELLGQNGIGPITVMLRLLNGVLMIINGLVRRIPQLGTLIVAAFAVGPILKATAAVRALAGSWGLVTASSTRAAAAQGVASAVPGGGGLLGMGGLRGLFRRRGPRPPGGAGGLSQAELLMSEGEALGGAGRLAGGLGRFGKVAGLGLRAAGKFALPLTLAMAGIDAYSAKRTGGFWNQAAQTGSAVATGASFGLIPQYKGADVTRDEALTKLATSADAVQQGTRTTGYKYVPVGRFGGQRRVATTAPIYTESYSQQLARATTGGQSAGAQASQIASIEKLQRNITSTRGAKTNEATQAFLAGLTAELNTRREILATMQAQEKQDARMGRRAKRDKAVGEIGAGFDILAGKTDAQGRFLDPKKAAAALKITMEHMTAQMERDPTTARKTGRIGLQLVESIEKANPKMKKATADAKSAILGEYDALHLDIKKVNGKIADGTRQGWATIRKAMTSETETMLEESSADFTTLQKNAVASLQAMGLSVAEARKLVAGMETSHNTSSTTPGRFNNARDVARNARGGRIPGRGLMDTVPVGAAMAAPGELIVNRHTERRIDGMLAGAGTSLGREVAGEGRPHSQRFQTGGRLTGMISQVASQYDLDPAAWAGIMWHESGLNPGAIGDNGTSFGLTQLHIGGALGNISVAAAQQYLDPMTNLMFAGGQMAGMGLGGLRGPAAIDAYSRRFERPANPGVEIADALAYYRAHQGDFAGGGKEDLNGILPGLATGGRVPGRARNPALDLTGGMTGGSPLARAIRAATAIDAMHYPYAWGGGHGRIGVPSSGTRHSSGGAIGTGFDCSGATSAVLGSAGLLGSPMVASSFMNWGTPGYDPHGLNVVASPSHVYMILNGRAFGTSTANPNGGAGWFAGGVRSGFKVNHAKNPGLPFMQMNKLQAPSPRLGGIPGLLEGASADTFATGLTAGVNKQLAAGAGFSTGGRVSWGGWHGRGGTIKARRPTLIGVGESGDETVHVTRGGGQGPGGAQFAVHIGTVVNHGGDVEREVAAAFEQFARRLESMGLVDEGEVIV